MSGIILQTIIRGISAIGRRTIGKDFAQIMATGCNLIRRFEDDPNGIYLTFDDSPNDVSTLPILEALGEQGIKATFFCIGRNVVRHPHLAKAIEASGHEVANHSMTHPDLWWISPRKAREDLARCQTYLQAVTGTAATSFRAPYSHFRRDLRSVGNIGLRHLVSCDVSPAWDETSPTAMAELILRDSRPGSIILLHDGLHGVDAELSNKAGAAAATCIGLIAPEIKARGLTFKTLAEHQLRATSPSLGAGSQPASSSFSLL